MIATRPWFSATVIITLALGIGVNTTVFTLVNAALYKPVPIPGGERLVIVAEHETKNPANRHPVSLPEYREYLEQNHTFSGLEAADTDQGVISENGIPPDRYDLAAVSPGLFGMLKTWPVLGRAFLAADGQRGAPRVALLSYSVWQKRYGGVSDIVGRTVQLNGSATTIIGVMPDGFHFPSTQDLWTPYVPAPENEDRTHRDLMLFGLLSPRTNIAAARADLAQISERMAKAFPETEKDYTALVQTFQESMNGGPIKLIFLLMLGAVGFVMLIACANVANMMLSRAQSRSREIAVRAALGASRLQIIRQLLVESVLLSALGGLLGLLLSQFGVHAFDLATQDVGKPYWVQFTMDWRAFAYFAALSLSTGLIFGIVPAWRASGVDLNTTLKDGTAGGTQRGSRLSGSLVVFQFALTVVLLAGAGVMIRSFVDAQRINPFVPAEHLLTARVSLPDGKGERYESVDARRKMHDRVLERLAALPGVTQVALSSDMPGLGSQTRDIEVEGHPNLDPKQPARAATVFATPNYLSTIGLPILMGRALNASDGLEGKEASIVTRSFAARYWPGESAVGRRFRFIPDGKPAAWVTVVGVCGDVVQDTMDPNPAPLAYFSNRQEPWAWLGILLRTGGDPVTATSSLRGAMQQLDPALPLFEVRTLPAAIDHEHWFLEVFGSLFLLFALIALAMALVGIYAVVAQATSRRTREIGIRMALGASAGRVVRLVLSRGLVELGAGLALGLAGAIAATRLMKGIPGLSSTNEPLIFILVVSVLLAAGLFASWLPARRAAKVDPLVALRTE
jgi:predicted permease